eukprot:COSAG04_NODE_5825_length_1483_cov_3.478324_2_plen_169_part_01
MAAAEEAELSLADLRTELAAAAAVAAAAAAATVDPWDVEGDTSSSIGSGTESSSEEGSEDLAYVETSNIYDEDQQVESRSRGYSDAGIVAVLEGGAVAARAKVAAEEAEEKAAKVAAEEAAQQALDAVQNLAGQGGDDDEPAPTSPPAPAAAVAADPWAGLAAPAPEDG